MNEQPNFPLDVTIDISGPDGNAFVILGRTAAALRGVGFSQEEIDRFWAEATSADYDHLCAEAAKYVKLVK